MLLAVLTFIAATFTTRREEDHPPPRDITPPDELGAGGEERQTGSP
jgi:hypothetical protein